MDVCGWKDKPEIQLCSSSRPFFFFASCHGLIRRRLLAKERNNNWRFCQRTKENNTHTHTIKQTRRFFRISRINSARIDVDVNAPLSLHKETNFKKPKKRGFFFFFVFWECPFCVVTLVFHARLRDCTRSRISRASLSLRRLTKSCGFSNRLSI